MTEELDIIVTDENKIELEEMDQYRKKLKRWNYEVSRTNF